MSNNNKTIGFPQMKEEAGEKRAFLPDFIQRLTDIGFMVYLEEGYGISLDFSFDDYKLENPGVHACSRKECFQKELVLILRSPHDDEYDFIGEQSVLISMLHFPTRPKRVALLAEKGMRAISLDSIADDFQIRLVENMKAVAWNSLEAAFNEFEKHWPTLIRENNKPWQVLVMGSGMVGKHAVDASTKFGRWERNTRHMQAGGSGVLVTCLARNITCQPERMQSLFQTADILVDATQRYDTSKPVVPNPWLANLPKHAIIVDLSVDPYTLDSDPPVVKGVEGIPQGNLDKYVFAADDQTWDDTVPQSIPSSQRRMAVTCYSWPGIHPESCMRHYGQQLLPLMRVLRVKSYDKITAEGGFFERALWRAKLATFLKKQSD